MRVARSLEADNWRDTEDPADPLNLAWMTYPYRMGMKGWADGKPTAETLSNMLPHIRAIYERPSSLTPNMFADTLGHAAPCEGRQPEAPEQAQSVE